MGLCAKVCVVLLALVAGLLYSQYRSLSAPAELPAFDVNAYWGPGARADYTENAKINKFTVSYARTLADGSAAADCPIAGLQADLKRPLLLHPPLEGVGFEYGVNSVALAEMVRYWRDDYLPRWPAREKFLNQFPQFTTQIQG